MSGDDANVLASLYDENTDLKLALVDAEQGYALARAEVVRLREALLVTDAILDQIADGKEDDLEGIWRIAKVIREALREEVSEPGSGPADLYPGSGEAKQPPGSLTSPVEKALLDLHDWASVFPGFWQSKMTAPAREFATGHSETSPVDTSALGPCLPHRVSDCPECLAEAEREADAVIRGYVEHGPGGPQAVYHAETPDAYLEHGDRP